MSASSTLPSRWLGSLVLLGLVIAGCGGDSDKGPTTPIPTPTPKLGPTPATGHWAGTISGYNNDRDCVGEIRFDVNGGNVANIAGYTCDGSDFPNYSCYVNNRYQFKGSQATVPLRSGKSFGFNATTTVTRRDYGGSTGEAEGWFDSATVARGRYHGGPASLCDWTARYKG